ncbi:MAG TPA: RagB/SusD family nutrient uptake outer membrane protein [Flavitalea sp.]|nr:RagB/SusD family nutrient uptake outer membrane protein [Flavitalea sp.]
MPISALLLLFFSGCNKFLEEEPTGFIDASKYYTTPAQAEAAVAGCYAGLSRLHTNRIGVSVSPLFAVEYMTGYSTRPYAPNSDDIQFLQLIKIDPANQHLGDWWNATFYPLENCNSVIANLSKTDILDEVSKKKFLGEAHFLRAWYYFQGVRLFGSLPLKTVPTLSLADTHINKAPVEDIYKQIVNDLNFAQACGLPWTDKRGHVTQGAIKALLAKVYITMAGYPLLKKEYYQLAYKEAAEVINSGEFSLFPNFADLRQQSKQNTGENIFMLQRDPVNAPNILHFSLMPYPYLPISIKPTLGGAMGTTKEFYNSFHDSDVRKKERVFFYNSYPQFGTPNLNVNFNAPYIFKYWDSTAELTNRAGLNVSLIRYAEVLLICAEAKSRQDGGLTSDPLAISSWHEVHSRAFPGALLPAKLEVDDILKERFWELCFEFQTWYDMLRTRKAFDVGQNKIVDLVGYKSPNHLIPFTEENLLFPIPLTEVQKNPNLK